MSFASQQTKPGQTLGEYSLIVSFLAIALVAFLVLPGDEVNGFYNAVDQALAALEL